MCRLLANWRIGRDFPYAVVDKMASVPQKCTLFERIAPILTEGRCFDAFHPANGTLVTLVQQCISFSNILLNLPHNMIVSQPRAGKLDMQQLSFEMLSFVTNGSFIVWFLSHIVLHKCISAALYLCNQSLTSLAESNFGVIKCCSAALLTLNLSHFVY